MEQYKQELQVWEEKMIRLGNIDIVRNEALIEPKVRALQRPRKPRKTEEQGLECPGPGVQAGRGTLEKRDSAQNLSVVAARPVQVDEKTSDVNNLPEERSNVKSKLPGGYERHVVVFAGLVICVTCLIRFLV